MEKWAQPVHTDVTVQLAHKEDVDPKVSAVLKAPVEIADQLVKEAQLGIVVHPVKEDAMAQLAPKVMWVIKVDAALQENVVQKEILVITVYEDLLAQGDLVEFLVKEDVMVKLVHRVMQAHKEDVALKENVVLTVIVAQQVQKDIKVTKDVVALKDVEEKTDALVHKEKKVMLVIKGFKGHVVHMVQQVFKEKLGRPDQEDVQVYLDVKVIKEAMVLQAL